MDSVKYSNWFSSCLYNMNLESQIQREITQNFMLILVAQQLLF